jgi:ATP-binding cassette, subfamily B, bacterial
MKPTKEKTDKNPIWNLLKTEWEYLRKERKVFSLFMFLFVIANLIALIEPLIIGSIFNTIQNSITSQEELRKLILKISLLLVVTIGFWAFHGNARYLERKTGFLVRRNFINTKISRVLDLPVSWHKDHHSGDTIDKINKGSSGIMQFSSHMNFRIIEGIVTLIGSIIILLFIDIRAAIFALFFAFGTLFIIFRFDRKIVELHRKINKFENKASASVFDYISNIITIITLRLKKTVKTEIDNRVMASFEDHKKRAILSEFKWAFASIAISIMTVVVISWRAYSDFNTMGVIMIGTLYMLYGYLHTIGRTFYNFASLYGEVLKSNARITNAKPIDDEFYRLKRELYGKIPSNWKKLSLKNVDFTYDKEGKEQHLSGINVDLRKGQKIAFVGESGSGKSTMLALIRGLYNPDKGQLYCDGERLKNDISNLKNYVTLIPQDPEIFNNTIRYNITMDISTKKEELDKAIDLAKFRKVLNRLENGLDTNVLEKGVSLSGGEKQRLAFARGILAAKSSDIVLMDEPTSSVDSLNETKIYESVFKVFKTKTIISAIHKLNLLTKFDYIYLFENGKIIAEGTLEEIKKNAKFKRFSSKLKI